MITPFHNNAVRIEICGSIASGKTTLANLLGSREIQIFLENFSSNPFWEAFYIDPVNTAFETEITFLLQHYHQIKIGSSLQQNFACDFSLALDCAYANVTLSGSRLDTFHKVYKEASSHLVPPALLIFLQCSPEIQLQRIASRGREIEKGITVNYLASLNDSLTSVISTLSETQKVLLIDSASNDFAHNEGTRALIVEQVLETLQSAS
ncbi:deoxynucleoside kinase [Nitrosospira multiformis]|uniref:deoxynucleoside kinase n=1 Tax=Nitrosospira multiformis TaxID=1231 RepID=UPI0008975E35|nr:deoxynucleoside kinase [Nitrosospira multiformis]SEA18418.1 Deoxyadenosine/deoxycytidine kinase [Nitrosospira multiformis]